MKRIASDCVFWALLLAALCSFAACSGGDDGKDPYEPWKIEDWLVFGWVSYETAPLTSSSQADSAVRWYHHVTGYGTVAVAGSWKGLDQLAGEGTVGRLQAMDTPSLRARYAASLADLDELRERISSWESASFPLKLFTLGFNHWTETWPTQQIEDPSLYTPLAGAVILPVGSDPAIDDNPELAALVAELLRIHDAWELHNLGNSAK